MYAILITVIVYATGGQILSAGTTSVSGYSSREDCEAVARTLSFSEANAKRTASCIEVR